MTSRHHFNEHTGKQLTDIRGNYMQVPMKILVIEDEHDIAELVQYNLEAAKYNVTVCSDGVTGLKRAQKSKPDLIVLDLMLPDMGGVEVCKQLRVEPATKHIPVIMLTAKGEEIDRIVGFEVGADDYLTKPFSPRELLMRIRAILRRVKARREDMAAESFTFGRLEVYPEKHEARVSGQPIKLTALEFRLLQFMYNSRGRVSSRDMLLDRVWGYDAALTTRTVDTHIKRLREKLGVAGDYIETVRGVGYRFKESLEAS